LVRVAGDQIGVEFLKQLASKSKKAVAVRI
jgi:hypothetical protein